jgi:hypothetical protein
MSGRVLNISLLSYINLIDTIICYSNCFMNNVSILQTSTLDVLYRAFLNLTKFTSIIGFPYTITDMKNINVTFTNVTGVPITNGNICTVTISNNTTGNIYATLIIGLTINNQTTLPNYAGSSINIPNGPTAVLLWGLINLTAKVFTLNQVFDYKPTSSLSIGSAWTISSVINLSSNNIYFISASN